MTMHTVGKCITAVCKVAALYFAISMPCSLIRPSGTCWKPVMVFFMPTTFFVVHK